MVVIIRDCAACEERADAFAMLHGTHGAWVARFREHDGFVCTERRRDATHPDRCDSIDRGRSAAADEAFLAAATPRYAVIEAQGDALTVSERRIGRFDRA